MTIKKIYQRVSKAFLPAAFALGVGLATPAYTQPSEWHIGPVPVSSTENTDEAIKSEPLNPNMDRFLDYTTFLAESILEVREIRNDYVSQKGIKELKGIQETLRQVKDLRKGLKELPLPYADPKSNDPLDQLLTEYNANREAKKEAEELDLSNPFKELGLVKPTPLSCSGHRGYRTRLSEIADSYSETRSATLRQDPEFAKNGLVQKFEQDLGSLLRSTGAQATRFEFENCRGGF